MHERERDRVAPALRGARRRIAALDLAAVRWVARVNSPALDRVMPALSEAANHGKLWIALGACLQATGNERDGQHHRQGPGIEKAPRRRGSRRPAAPACAVDLVVPVRPRGLRGRLRRRRDHGDARARRRGLPARPGGSCIAGGHRGALPVRRARRASDRHRGGGLHTALVAPSGGGRVGGHRRPGHFASVSFRCSTGVLSRAGPACGC